MRNVPSTILIAAFAIASFAGGASARDGDRSRHQDRGQYVSAYCAEHPRTADCRAWRREGRQWDEDDYRGFYERNHRPEDRSDSTLAAIFGLTPGAVIAGSGNDHHGPGPRDDRSFDERVDHRRPNRDRDDRDHRRACAERYWSYNSNSDTYMASDGRRYTCRL